MKFIVVIFVLLILASLGSALFFLITDHGQSKRTVKALAVRVGLSVTVKARAISTIWRWPIARSPTVAPGEIP